MNSKDFENIAKKALNSKTRRELLKTVYTPKSSSLKNRGSSYDKQLSSSSFFNSYNSPMKRSSSKSLPKSSNDSNICLIKPHLIIHNKKAVISKKKSKLLKFNRQIPLYPKQNQKCTPKNLKKSPIKEKYENLWTLAFRTRTGSIQGKQKPHNQDEFFVIQGYGQSTNQTLIGVMDGHGIYGQEVSAFVKRQLPIFIESNMPSQMNTNPSLDIPPIILYKLSQSLALSYQYTQRSLISSGIDINFSGSTAITILLREKALVCSNIGDSRAIIGRYSETWYPIELSHDHKPSNIEEKQRIIKAGGRVEPFMDKNGHFDGPERVWLQYEQTPGLAMSRSFGDLVAARVGVINEPEIISHTIQDEDKFIIIASDGIWEFISNQSCVNIIAEFYMSGDIEKACDQLMSTAVEIWNQENYVVDDITFVVLFLNN